MNEIKNKKAFSKWLKVTLRVFLIIIGALIITEIAWQIWDYYHPRVTDGMKILTSPELAAINNNSSSKSNNNSSNTTSTSDVPLTVLKTFNKTGFSFTFKYPSTWTLGTATNSKDQPSAKVAQETVKITSDSGVEFRFDNPIIATGFEEYDLNHAKDISAGTLTFQRNYGNNAEGTTLYVATHNDAQNIDALSVSFFGTGKISDADIAVLDEIVSSFKFN